MDEQEEKLTKDVIIQEPKTIMFIDDQAKINALTNPDLYPIVALLRQKNQTVKEITESYPIFSPSSSTKSDKTIYRYLKELKSLNLVDVVGHRVTLGQTATEKIWGRTAKIFYVVENEPVYPDENVFICDENCTHEASHYHFLKGMAIAKLLSNVLGPLKEEDIDYSVWIKRLEEKIKTEIKAVVEGLPEDDLHPLTQLPYISLENLLSVVALMSLFKRSSKTLQEFYSVFQDNSFM